MAAPMKSRIFMTGVGGQGTLTATRILAQAALDKDLAVTAGEVHGMAQRGGVVESTVLIGGYLSPRISHGEADVLLGFEPLETLRALAYLKPGGVIVSNEESIPTIGVSLGREVAPELAEVRAEASRCASAAHFLPCLSLGAKAGTPQSANMVLLGAMCALEIVPVSLDDLAETIKKHLKPRLQDINLRAIELGADAVRGA